MLQVDKTVNLMLQLNFMLHEENNNVILSPFGLEIFTFNILSGITGKCYDEACNVLFGTEVQFEDVVEAIRCYKMLITYIKNMKDIDFHMKNMVYVSNKFNPLDTYVEFVQTFLDTCVKKIDFNDKNNPVKQIVIQDTKETLPKDTNQYRDFFDRLSNMFVVNSMSFQCELKFKPHRIYEGKFKKNNNIETSVKFTVYRNKLKYLDNRSVFGFSYVELPYKNENLTLGLLLPDINMPIKTILERLTYNQLSQLFRTSTPTQIEVHLPVTRLQNSTNWTTLLRHVGINKVFEKEEANFSKMCANHQGLFIESLVANIELNLQDISKPSSTVTNKSSKSSNQGSFGLVFQRPFIYFICSRKKLETVILFTGVVNNVEKEE